MTTLLFFDDEPLSAREQVVRKLGKPRRIQESVYHDPSGNCTWGYPAVFRDPEDTGWLLLYGINFNKESYSGGGQVGLARSADGVHWIPATDAGRIAMPNRKAPNQLVVAPNMPGIFSSGFELHEPVAGLERYNLLWQGKGSLWTSKDGVAWAQVDGVCWQNPCPDPPSFVCWNPVRKRFVLTTRPDHSVRQIEIFETRDFRAFTPLELALHADSQDRALTQIYGFPTFAYDNWFIGLPWMFDISASERTSLPHKYLSGKQYAQLAYSRNGWHWNRSLREPFIGNGEPGEPDAGCLQASAMIQLEDGALRFYASTSRHEHGHCPPDDGYIVAYGLRRDGFVYLESDGGVGTVATRMLYWHGGEAELNVQAPAGWVRVQVTDPKGNPLPGYTFADSTVLHDDQTSWIPTWKDGKTLAALADQMIRLEIQLENARLYAIRGDCFTCSLADLHRYKNGIRPQTSVF